MEYREITQQDFKELHALRMSVKENVLSNPNLVTEAHYNQILEANGKGWLCENANEIVGFAMVDTDKNNIWALFIKPGFEGIGIGKALHDMMLDWYFNQSQKTLWLGTSPNTRAERFYRTAGWIEKPPDNNVELRFEMTFADWKSKKGDR